MTQRTSVTNSVFVKLFLVFMGAGLLIHFAVFSSIGYFMAPPQKARHRFGSIFEKFSASIEKELQQGFTPDHARELLKDTGIELRAEGPKGWTTSDSIPHVTELQANRKTRPGSPFSEGRIREHHYWIREVSEPEGITHLVFLTPGPPFQALSTLRILGILTPITLIIVLSYFAIRRFLNPINELAKAVSQLSLGNIDYAVPVQSDDELGKVGASFNTMTQQIREMIHAKERLLLDVSHELRSPLTRAKLIAEMLPAGESRTELQGELREMESMIHGLLENARLKSGNALHKQRVDIVSLAKEAVLKFGKGARVDLIDAPQHEWIEADPEKVKTVLKNLIENAVKYSSPTSPVEIRVKILPQCTEVTIQDQGIGIPPEDLEHVFEPFYRVDKSRTRQTGGYGLGLSLVRKIMEAHGGTASIYSAASQGTSVTLRFPKTV